MRIKPAFFAYKGDKEKLERFLKGQQFNCHSQFGIDKNNNRLIKLYWDSRPDSDWGKTELKAIICMIGTGEMDDENISKISSEVNLIIAGIKK